MDELSSIDGKGFLICLIRDSISDLGAEHHLIAAHEVSHDVFESWLESLRVNQVEVDLVISGDLDSFVTLNEENEASCLDLIVLFPFVDDVLVLIFLLKDFEKDDFA
jgi:hypothetical protein